MTNRLGPAPANSAVWEAGVVLLGQAGSVLTRPHPRLTLGAACALCCVAAPSTPRHSGPHLPTSATPQVGAGKCLQTTAGIPWVLIPAWLGSTVLRSSWDETGVQKWFISSCFSSTHMHSRTQAQPHSHPHRLTHSHSASHPSTLSPPLPQG